MSTKAIVFAVAAVCLGSASSAFAQQYDGDYRKQRSEQVQRDSRYERDGRNDNDRRYDHDRRYDNDNRYERHDNDRAEYRRDRFERQREWRQDYRQQAPVYSSYGHRGGGPRYDLYQGSRLPSAYYGDRYVVSDWHRYNLNAPPRGMHWVRAGDDYLLVALATGIIAQVLLNN